MSAGTAVATIEVWSDVACPWCYIGRTRFLRALGRFPGRDRIEVTWRAFQLSPDTPVGARRSEVDALMELRGITREQVMQMFDQAARAGAAAGVSLDFDTVIAANTFDAHRLIAMAGEHREVVMDNLFRAHFESGKVIDDRDVLAEIAVESGLDDGVRARLETDEAVAEVTADLEDAAALGVTGVPFFVANRRVAISGAQPEDMFAQLFTRALMDVG